MSNSPFSIFNARTGAVLATEARLADTFFSRFKGLMGTRSLPAGHGLLIVPCNSVHCFGMRYAIDVAFLTKDGTVLKLMPEMKPGAVSPIVRGAHMTLELPAGTLENTGTQVGDRLDLPALA